MSKKAAIYSALQTVLYHDGETYDLGTTMNGQPYNYNTPDLMRGFLQKISDELASDVPPINFDPTSLNATACMTVTLQNLATQIFNNT